MLSNKNKSPDTLSRRQAKGIRRAYFSAVLSLTLCAVLSCPALATSGGGSDPLSIVNNLSDFIFSCIKAIGVIVLGWGIVQVGLSLQSHDPSQRSNGFLTLAGGIVITFAEEILTLITG